MGPMFASCQGAAPHWTPRHAFDVVVHEVPTTAGALSVQQLLQALDPDGLYREHAEQAGMDLTAMDQELEQPEDQELEQPEDQDMESSTLAELAEETKRRADEAPRGGNEEDVFTGDASRRGYQFLSARELQTQCVVDTKMDNELEWLDSPTVFCTSWMHSCRMGV